MAVKERNVTKELEDTSKLKGTRQDIARVKTILKEKELNEKLAPILEKYSEDLDLKNKILKCNP